HRPDRLHGRLRVRRHDDDQPQMGRRERDQAGLLSRSPRAHSRSAARHDPIEGKTGEERGKRRAMTDPTTHHHHHDHDGVATTESGHVNDSHAEHDGHTMEHGDHAGHGDHGSGHGGHASHGDHVGQFRRLFWINLVLATVMYAWGGTPFLTGAVSELKSRQPGMMLLIALGITVAFLASWAATLGLVHHELEFWWELALLIVIMLLGHWIEMRSLAQTTSALDSLAALLPDEAERVEGDDVVTVDPADLRVGDIVVVRPGGSVPADGTIVDGRADMDESMITGESRPVARGEGENVTAGTVATDSGLRVEITATGDDTALAGINRLVAEAQGSSSR